MIFLKYLLLFTFIARALLYIPIVARNRSLLLTALGMGVTFFFVRSQMGSEWLIIPLYFSFLILIWLLFKFVTNSNLALVVILAALCFLRIDKSYILWGFSYIALRLIWLNLEIKQKQVAPPKICEYLAFVFYFPSLATGPFFSFKHFQNQLNEASSTPVDYHNVILRSLWGLCKLLVLATSIHPLATSQLMLNGYRHGIFDLILSLISFYIYIYLNFSGSIDVLLAASQLLGIKLPENFDSPFKATNISEFWTRWHITLGNFLRFTVFFPLQKKLIQKFPSVRNHTGAAALGLTMLLMGLWHGFEMNFIIYGGLQAIGLIAHYYFSQFSKNKLNWGQSKYSVVLAWILTHGYIAFTLLFFGNSMLDLKKIWSALVFL